MATLDLGFGALCQFSLGGVRGEGDPGSTCEGGRVDKVRRIFHLALVLIEEQYPPINFPRGRHLWDVSHCRTGQLAK